MFGGLEIKAACKDSKDEDDEPPASSGFGFLNTGEASAPAEPAPAASSGFSFLAGGTEAASSTETPASAAPSGFSFLQEATSSAQAVEPSKEPAAASGFSFMLRSPSGNEEEGKPPPESEKLVVPSAALPEGPSSAFDFLSPSSSTAPPPEPTPAIPQAASPAAAISSTSSTVSTDVPPPVNVLEAPAPVPSGFAGAGVTFGTATATKTVRKKKSRAQRVGMGATVQPPAPLPAAAPAPPPSATKSESPKSTRDAADDAMRRAEEFMQQKSIEKAETVDNEALPRYDEPQPNIKPTASTDEEVAAAMAAAKEAQTMSKHETRPKGFMGTFFKGFGGSNSNLGANGARRPSPPRTANNSVDQLAKKQEDMKRAMAEREMKMQQQALAGKDEEVVTVSASVGAYQPEQLPTVSAPKEAPAASSSPLTFEPVKPKTPQYVVREVAPAPKKKKTAKDKFEEYEALFAESVHRAMEQVETVRGQRKTLLEDRFVSLAKQSLATQQIAHTESQLQMAVDEEDYELADQLGQVIEAHKREKNEVAMFLDSITAGLEQLDSQKSLVVKGVASCFENLTVRLTELQEKEAAAEQTNDSETLKQFATISKQLSTEQERLQRELKTIELDEERAAEERKALEADISEQAGEFEKQQESVKEELSEIEVEIEVLRRKLEEKQKMAANLRKEMYGLEDSISKVRVKFTRQLNRVDKKETSVRESRIEWETEQRTFQVQKDAHELQVKTHSENLLAHDELKKVLEEELRLAKEFSEFVPTKLGILEDPGDADDEKDSEAEGDLAQLQADVVKCEAAVSEAKVLLKAASAAIQNLETEHASLIAKIPQLEEDKKAAAAKRDFKGAGKASKDIKDASARLKECEEELVGEAAFRKKTAEDDLQRLNAELAEAQQIAGAKEKLSAQRKMTAFSRKIEILASTKKELCGDCSSSENNVKGVGALVLDIQMKALQDEGESLGRKYGGWDVLVGGNGTDGKTMQDPEVEEDGNTEKAPENLPLAAPISVDREKVKKAREVINAIQSIEEAVEVAAATEDFEKAGELQENSEKLQSELEGLGLSDQEMELALSDEDIPSGESEEPVNPVEANEATDVAVEETAGPSSGDEEQATVEDSVSDLPTSSDEGNCEVDDCVTGLPAGEEDEADRGRDPVDEENKVVDGQDSQEGSSGGNEATRGENHENNENADEKKEAEEAVTAIQSGEDEQSDSKCPVEDEKLNSDDSLFEGASNKE